jgi:hypothetical protein
MTKQDETQDFARQAEEAQTGVLREIWQWLRHSGKWWLTPIVLGLLLVGGLVILSSTAVAPFIYTLF